MSISTNIPVTGAAWVDLNAASGAVKGSKLSIVNKSTTMCRIQESATQPLASDTNGELISGMGLGYARLDIESTTETIWALLTSADHSGLLTISYDTHNGAVTNHGIPLDVTRQLRIEGHNPNVSGGNVWHDIWEGGALVIPEPSPAGQQLQIQSSSVDDVAVTGTGARVTRLIYLSSGDQLLTEDIPLNGTTPVLTVATDITDVIDLFNIEVGSTTTTIGRITLTEPADTGLIYNTIEALGNKSLSTLRHLLPTSTFYITHVTLSGDTKGTDVILRSNSDDSGAVFDDVFLFNIPVTMSDAPATMNFSPAIVVPPQAKVKVSARGQASGSSVSVFINGWVKV